MGQYGANAVILFFWYLRTYLLLLRFLIFLSHTFPIIKLPEYGFRIKRKLNLTTFKGLYYELLFDILFLEHISKEKIMRHLNMLKNLK